MIDLSHRINEPELMDSIDLEKEELITTLRFLALAHRYFGGENVLFNHLKKWSARWKKNETITFLDVGTGGAEVPLSLVRWGKKSGFHFQVTAIDSTPVIAQIARENTRNYPEIEVIEDDFFSFAKTGKQFDYVTASLLLHHIPDEKLVEILKLCNSMAKKGIIFSDLIRSRSALWGIRMTTSLLGNRIARHDGPLSVRRAFTLLELNLLAKKAGLEYLSTHKHLFFRLSLAGEKQ
jgi:2-polyprenyl-3-methyl-5-hydroxy-6-metoxy-1,4-benzoquinol methylase